MRTANSIMKLFTPAFKRKIMRVLKKETPAVASMVRFYLYGDKSRVVANVSPEDLAHAQILSSTFRVLCT